LLKEWKEFATEMLPQPVLTTGGAFYISGQVSKALGDFFWGVNSWVALSKDYRCWLVFGTTTVILFITGHGFGLFRNLRWLKARKLKIRSFDRGTTSQEYEPPNGLDLTQHFNGRAPRTANGWVKEVSPAVCSFLKSAPSKTLIRLDTSGGIALLAGYCFDPKSGIESAVFQGKGLGSKIWSDERTFIRPPEFQITEDKVSSEPDLVAVFSLTHRIGQNVKTYLKRKTLPAGTLTCFDLPDVGHKSVNGGYHASILALQVEKYLRERRSKISKTSCIHLFCAAPNAFLFFLGKRLHGIGKVVFYEHEFEGNRPDGYVPGISLPTKNF
jgi:hypothetical protein